MHTFSLSFSFALVYNRASMVWWVLKGFGFGTVGLL